LGPVTACCHAQTIELKTTKHMQPLAVPSTFFHPGLGPAKAVLNSKTKKNPKQNQKKNQPNHKGCTRLVNTTNICIKGYSIIDTVAETNEIQNHNTQ
jgi:hypothetical protein